MSVYVSMVRLITYNLQYFEGSTKNILQYFDLYHVFREKKSIELKMLEYISMYNPDVLSLVEIDSGSKRVLGKDELKRFSERLGLEFVAHSIKYAKTGFFKIFRVLPFFKNQENAILSRKRLRKIQYHYLKKGSKRVVIEATLEENNITFFIVHLALFRKARLVQIKDLKRLLVDKKKPYVVVGDFNSFVKEEIDLLKEGSELVDAYDVATKSSKDRNTTPSWNPRYPLDNVLVSDDIKVTNYEVLDAHFSDHLPVMVDLEIQQ